jgi:hypothetical protein
MLIFALILMQYDQKQEMAGFGPGRCFYNEYILVSKNNTA